ncbi:MAG: hypothetical protein Kow0056_13650 [Coriobacteriia bacterium]
MDSQLILDRYRPLAELGSGGHGDVILAFDTRMARRVAVKRVPIPRGATEAGLREARTAAMLNHPAVTTVHEWDTDETHAYIITEYVEGADLADILDEYGPLDLDSAAAIIQSVANALAFAHENGVLHLDIKPENVLVTREGRVKLADFGIAALTGAGGKTAAPAGTFGFMPPEQLRGEDVDERTDQWAFAALAFEVLADANPFQADTREGAIFRAVDVEPPAPTDFEPDLPPAVDDILLAALSPDPDERYPQTAAFSSALLAQLGDPDSGRERLARMVSALVEEGGDLEEEPLGLWDRLARFAPIARGACAAALSGWLVWAGLRPYGMGTLPTLGSAALIAAVGAISPALGLAVGLVAVGVGLLADSMLFAMIFFAAAIAYWALLGRTGRFPALTPVAAPAFGVAPLALSPPLVLGFGTGPLTASFAAAWSAATLQAASAITGHSAPYLDVSLSMLYAPWEGPARLEAVAELITHPSFYITVVGWALGAAIMSLFSRSGTRTGAAAGVVLSSFVLLGAYGVLGVFGPEYATDLPQVMKHAAGSLILVAIVIALGAPTRGATD